MNKKTTDKILVDFKDKELIELDIAPYLMGVVAIVMLLVLIGILI